LIALVLSVAVTSVFYVRLSHQQAANRPKMKKLVSAAVALSPGTPLTEENVTEIDWPESVPLEGAIAKKEDAIKRVLIYSVAANQPLFEHDFAEAGSSLGLSAKIPDGMRATAIRVNEVNNVAGFLNPGSKVDVLATLRGENNQSSTRTVLQNIQVLAAGNRTEPDPQGKPENVSVITLLVTPDESQRLALAQQQGTIQFVLRNGGDQTRTDTAPVSSAELQGAPHVAPHVSARRAPALPTITVETVAGGKSTVAKFPSGSE
jgi:pilus assembly protein CpaB